uniref:RING-type domain-containing protein n=1 Tax=Dunaliella tertiolecta TaxID=3047 RepID=A0A7S3VPG8_DUNTE
MEAIEEAESRRPLFAPPRGPAAPFRPPSFTSHSAIPPPPSRSNRSRGLSFESHVFGPGPSPSRSRPHSYGAFRGRSHRTGEGSSNRSLPPLPHALFGMMDSDTDDSRDGYEYERGRHGRGPMLGRGRGGFGFGMGLFGGPFGGGMGGRGFGMQGLLAAGGRGSNLPPNLLFSDRDFTADDYEALCRLDESVENRTGATRAEINALPTEVVRKTKPQAGSAEQEGGERVEVLECAICIEEVQPGEVLRTTPCLHKFHKVRVGTNFK